MPELPKTTVTAALVSTLLLYAAASAGEAETRSPTSPPADMPLGADDAGNSKPIFSDPVLAAAFEQMGFDFLMVHVWRNTLTASGQETIDALNRWAERTRHDYIVNLENTVRPRGTHPELQRPGFFFQPTAEWLSRCLSSPHFLGVCYDEAEHWLTNGVDVTAGAHSVTGFRPHFFDAEGVTVREAYDGNLGNLMVLREKLFGFASASCASPRRPMIRSEHVFPTLFPLFARAGVAPHPKLLKESVLPVVTAVALGACRQYGVPYVPCLDLWGPRGPRGSRKEWPYHTPQELRSALLFSYWTGAHAAYIENINYKDSLYRDAGGKPELTDWGRVAREFRREYMPAHPRAVKAEDFRPEIVIVRFPDSDWGQVSRGHIRQNLYGASNLVPDGITRAWLRVWRVITHGTTPGTGLTWHADGFTMPFRLFFPANSVAVYDHLAADSQLYEGVRLVFLLGIEIPDATMATIRAFVQAGGTAATVPRLAPEPIRRRHSGDTSIVDDGKGRWIVFDRAEDPTFREAVAPYLGSPDELRYTFRDAEVVFTAPSNHAELCVRIRPRR